MVTGDTTTQQRPATRYCPQTTDPRKTFRHLDYAHRQCRKPQKHRRQPPHQSCPEPLDVLGSCRSDGRLPLSRNTPLEVLVPCVNVVSDATERGSQRNHRSEEHTSELQSLR